jgi:NAD+ kinase
MLNNMAAIPKRIGIVANMGKTGALSAVPLVESEFLAHGMEVRIAIEAADALGRSGEPVEDLIEWSDMIVALGGDGTLLGVASKMYTAPKPIIGVNIGTLGFLTTATTDEVKDLAAMVACGEYEMSERLMLKAQIETGPPGNRSPQGLVYHGLNECTISRGRESKIVKLETRVDGDFLTNYNADGLIVATPTGSTAYSLSAGGPIIAPNSGVLVLTPICPHALSIRPLIVSDRSVIEVEPLDADDEVLLNIDGHTIQRLAHGMTVRIQRSELTLPLLRRPETNFYDTLRAKLRWHGSNV